MSADKVLRNAKSDIDYVKSDANGIISLNGVISSKSGVDTDVCTRSEDADFLRCSDQQRPAAGDYLLRATNSPQMLPTGARTRCMNSPDNGNASLEDVDVIDIDGLNLDDEDGWLLKLKEPLKDSPSPYAWVREGFEHKGLVTPSGSLLHVLEQASKKKVPRFSAVPITKLSLSPCETTDAFSSKISANAETSQKECGTVRPEKTDETVCTVPDDTPVANTELQSNTANTEVPSNTPDSSLMAPKTKGRYEIDTRTFTRPKKIKHSLALKPLRLAPGLSDSVAKDGTDDTLADSDGQDSSVSKVEEPVEQQYDTGEHFLKLEDVTDVQVLARIQEENLRQSYSTTPVGLTPKSLRRGLSDGTGLLATGHLAKGQSNSSLSCPSDVSSPSCSIEEPLNIMKSLNSLSSTGSESSRSRSESLTNINPSQVKDSQEFGETHQHSLPNLAKVAKFSLPRSVPSDSKLYVSPGRRSLPSCVPSGAKSQENSFSKKTSSAQETNITAADPQPSSSKLKGPSASTTKPASGIPKPVTTSRLRQPTKWKKNLTTQAPNDGSWREGCF